VKTNSFICVRLFCDLLKVVICVDRRRCFKILRYDQFGAQKRHQAF